MHFARNNRVLLLVLVAASMFVAAQAKGAEVVLDIRIEHGRVPESQARLRVNEGDTVHLRFSVDRPLTLHLHGYDIEQRVDPDRIGTMKFEARATGRFPLRVHDPAAREKAHQEALLLYVEVYPR
jgi:hypothetical protein